MQQNWRQQKNQMIGLKTIHTILSLKLWHILPWLLYSSSFVAFVMRQLSDIIFSRSLNIGRMFFFEASISFSNYLVKIFLQTCFVLGVYVASSNSLRNHVINSEFIWSILMVMCCSSGIPKRGKSWKKYLIFWFMICSNAFVSRSASDH